MLSPFRLTFALAVAFGIPRAEAQTPVPIPPNLRELVSRLTIDRLGGVAPEVDFTPANEHVTRVHVAFELEDAVRQEDWRVLVEPAFAPRLHWAPHLTPTDRHVIDQHSFRSPALIAADAERWFALVPDLDVLARGSPVRWYMDLDAPAEKFGAELVHRSS